MPYKSQAQRRFFHSAGAKKAGITSKEVKEFDQASKGLKLPEKKKKKAVKMDKKELISEHKHLVKVLKNPTKKNLSKEVSKQSKELKSYERSSNTGKEMLKKAMKKFAK